MVNDYVETKIGFQYMGTLFRIRQIEPYKRLMKFYKIGPLLEGCFMVLSPIFKIGPCLEPLLEMLLRCCKNLATEQFSMACHVWASRLVDKLQNKTLQYCDFKIKQLWSLCCYDWSRYLLSPSILVSFFLSILQKGGPGAVAEPTICNQKVRVRAIPQLTIRFSCTFLV